MGLRARTGTAIRLGAAGLVCALVAGAGQGRALAFPEGADIEDRPPLPEETDARRAPAGYWHRGKTRLFLATRVDIGFLFLKPRISLGYGRPHSMWVGVDVNPIISGDGVGAWGGVRLALPVVDLRLGARYRYTFERSFLEPRESYTRDQVEDRAGPHASYLSLEAELTANLEAGPGSIYGELSLTHVGGVASGLYVFEHTIRAVVAPPWVWRARLGYMVPWDERGLVSVGVVGEVVGLPGRDAVVVRGGLVARLRLFRNLEGRVTLMPVFHSPDPLGVKGSDFLLVGVRYTWATGAPLF